MQQNNLNMIYTLSSYHLAH